MGRKVLLASESTFTRTTIKNILHTKGFEIVDEAANGWMTIQKYDALRPDLLMMDILMPDMRGIEVIREIMSIDPGAKIIVCSAAGRQDYILDAVKAGVCDYIIRPFQAERILDAVNKALLIS